MEDNKRPVSIAIPEGVKILCGSDFILVQGPAGTLIKEKGSLVIAVKDKRVYLLSPENNQGLILFSRLQSLIRGVSEGYSKILRLIGVGFRVWEEKPGVLGFKVGHTHPVSYKLPKDITALIAPNKGVILILKGCEVQRVNQVAREIRTLRKPNAYTGKGICYASENIVLKPGKREKK